MIDLHNHTESSHDGSDAPEAVIERASELGLSAIALTEHDNVKSLERGERRAKELGIEYIHGMEITCCRSIGQEIVQVDVLGYFFPWPSPGIEALVRDLETRRSSYLELVFKGLRILGIPVTPDVVRAEFPDRRRSMTWVRATLQRKGHAVDKQASRNLQSEAVAAAGRADLVENIDAREAIERLRRAGATTFMAHPFWLTRSARGGVPEEVCWTHMEHMIDLGIDGFEAYSRDRTTEVLDFCRRHKLPASGGSDSHAGGDTRVLGMLDTDSGRKTIGEELLESMKRHRDGKSPWK